MSANQYVWIPAIGHEADGVVIICAKDGMSMRVIGSSLKISANKRDEVVSFVVLVDQLKPGDCGLVVFTAREQRQGFQMGFAVTITNNGGKMFVELNRPWQYTADRFGQVYWDHVEVQIKGRIFSSIQPQDGHKFFAVVPDADLLCRYLAGTADAIEVLHAATQVRAEENAKRRLTEVERELKATKQELEKTTLRLGQYVHATTRLDGQLREVNQRQVALVHDYDFLKNIATKLNAGAKGRWRKSPELKIAIADFDTKVARGESKAANPQ